MNDRPQVQNSSQLEREIELLSQRTVYAESIVRDLAERLSPVLRPEGQVPTVDEKAEDKPILVPHAHRIRESRIVIENFTSKLDHLLSILEV
jgi:hypothetical protein